MAVHPLPPLDDGLDRDPDVAGEDSPGGGGRLPVDAAGGNDVGVAQLGRGERWKTRRLGALGNVILAIEIFQELRLGCIAWADFAFIRAERRNQLA